MVSQKNKGDFEFVQFVYDTSLLCRYELREKNWRLRNILLETERYFKENQMSLNFDTKHLLYFSAPDKVEPTVTIERNLLESAESCR